MPIYHYTGYVSKQKSAQQHQFQVRTINDWIRKRSPAPEHFSYVTVDGYPCIKDIFDKTPPPQGVALHDLEWVRNFARRNKMNFERVYEDIIRGVISGVILADRIFIIKTEPQVLQYIANYKREKKVRTRY